MQRILSGASHAEGTTLLSGQHFTRHGDQNSPRVAVVNQQFARKIFGSVETAIGGYYKMPEPSSKSSVLPRTESRVADRRATRGGLSPHSAVALELELAGCASDP
jgi:hypothetical protein